MTTPQLVAAYCDHGIVLAYAGRRILLTRQGAIATATALRSERTCAFTFGTEAVVLGAEEANALADHIDRAVAEFDEHLDLIAAVNDALGGDSDEK